MLSLVQPGKGQEPGPSSAPVEHVSSNATTNIPTTTARRHVLTKKTARSANSPQTVSFLPAVTYVMPGQGTAAGSLAVADVNGDGKPDVIVTNVITDCCGVTSIAVLLGNGDGTLQPPILNTSLSNIGEFNALAVADVNGDGKPDLVVSACCASNGDSEAAVLLGDGDGTFQSPRLYDLNGTALSSIAVADLNGDGKPDIASANYDGSTSSSVTVLLGNGDGTFQSPVSSLGPVDASCLRVADVNGDGRPDALVCSQNTVAVLMGNGDGSFQPFTNTNFNTGFGPNTPAIADVNGDGVPDMVVPNGGALGLAHQTLAGILLASGNGTFLPEVEYAAATSNTDAVGAVDVADINGDGIPDLIVTSGFSYGPSPQQVGVLLGNGDGTFQPSVVFSTNAPRPLGVAAIDLNGDGKPDIVTSNFDQTAVSVLINNTSSSGAPTSTVLSTSPKTSVYGQPVTLTATVTSSSGSPTGSVIFYNGSASLGSASLSTGVASVSVASLPAGSDSITATYEGSSTFAPSTSSPMIETVTQASTSTVLSSSASTVGTGQSVTFTASVSSKYGGATSGSVTFYSGSQSLGTATLSAGTAALTTSFSSVGTYSITAQYGGDFNNTGSTSTVLKEKVAVSTTTGLTSSLNPAFVGQTIIFTATVSSSSGLPPNGEIITFYNGTSILGTSPLSAGVATFATSSLAAGTYSVTASYPGDSTFASSTSPVLTQTVKFTTKSATTTALGSSLNPSTYGQKVSLTASVTSAGGSVPTGKVTFSWSIYTLGTATLNSSGVATLTKSNLNADPYPVIATYKGDANDLSSASSVLNQVVNQAVSSATLISSPNPSNIGQAVTFTATITSPTTKPAGPVTFTAGKTVLGTVQLSGGKATFVTSSLAVGSTKVTATYSGNSNIKGSSASVTQVVH